jgi:hypothetical protein
MPLRAEIAAAHFTIMDRRIVLMVAGLCKRQGRHNVAWVGHVSAETRQPPFLISRAPMSVCCQRPTRRMNLWNAIDTR